MAVNSLDTNNLQQRRLFVIETLLLEGQQCVGKLFVYERVINIRRGYVMRFLGSFCNFRTPYMQGSL